MVPLEFQMGPGPQVFLVPHMKASLYPTWVPCLTSRVGALCSLLLNSFSLP